MHLAFHLQVYQFRRVCILLWKIVSKVILHLTPNQSFTTLGKAVCETLRECGIISSTTNVYVERGYVGKEEIAFFLQLRNASLHDQNIFNTAITELLSFLKKQEIALPYLRVSTLEKLIPIR